MKPFTLEWWIKQYTEARRKMDRANFDGWQKYSAQMSKLANWIVRRIVRKYGERAE